MSLTKCSVCNQSTPDYELKLFKGEMTCLFCMNDILFEGTEEPESETDNMPC